MNNNFKRMSYSSKKSANKLFICVFSIILVSFSTIFAHGGKTDSSGGHNCSSKSISKGLCSGYHSHSGGKRSNSRITKQKDSRHEEGTVFLYYILATLCLIILFAYIANRRKSEREIRELFELLQTYSFLESDAYYEKEKHIFFVHV